MNLLPILFAVNFSLLLLHEMDAIRAKEWKMFIILKDMPEETAYIAFSLIHFPLYIWVIFSVSQYWNGSYALVWLIADVFLILHAGVHLLFRKHADNGFKSAYSNMLIYAMAALSAAHLIMIFCISVRRGLS